MFLTPKIVEDGQARIQISDLDTGQGVRGGAIESVK